MQGNDKLRQELVRRGLSPADLAKTIGMDRGKVRKVLRGSEDIRLVDVARVAKALGFKVDLMFESTTVLDALVDRRVARRARVQWV